MDHEERKLIDAGLTPDRAVRPTEPGFIVVASAATGPLKALWERAEEAFSRLTPLPPLR